MEQSRTHECPSIDGVSTWRLNLLRAMYALMSFGLATYVWPNLVSHSSDWAISHGHLGALLSAIGLLSFLGLRYPLRMLPIMLFELAWKSIWVIAIAGPLWLRNEMTADLWRSAAEIGFGVVAIPAVIPWRYVYEAYLRAPPERWL